jgi:drug/metabolite transporter, DME family
VAAVITGNLLAAAASLPFALPLPMASLSAWLTVVYLGVFQIGLAYVFLTSAMRHLPALEVSLLLLFEPVLNPVWTWLVRGERPGTWTIFGGAAIVAATAIKALSDAARRPTEVRPVRKRDSLR